MNVRMLSCEKQKKVLAIGQEGSISDYKERLQACFQCYHFITCKNSQEYLNGIINQQNNIISLQS